MMPQTKGVPALIEKVARNILTLVYVGDTCLFGYPTNQDAWEHLKGLVAVGDSEDDWPQEVHMVLILHDEAGVRIAQIGHVGASDDNKLVYTELWGDDFGLFRDKVLADWPTTKESDYVSRLLCI